MDWDGLAGFIERIWALGAGAFSIIMAWLCVYRWGWPRFWPFCRCNRRREK